MAESDICVVDVVTWVNAQTDQKNLRLVRDAVTNRIHELEHQDQFGAGVGTTGAGYQPVNAPGAKRQP